MEFSFHLITFDSIYEVLTLSVSFLFKYSPSQLREQHFRVLVTLATWGVMVITWNQPRRKWDSGKGSVRVTNIQHRLQKLVPSIQSLNKIFFHQCPCLLPRLDQISSRWHILKKNASFKDIAQMAKLSVAKRQITTSLISGFRQFIFLNNPPISWNPLFPENPNHRTTGKDSISWAKSPWHRKPTLLSITSYGDFQLGIKPHSLYFIAA